MRSFLISCGLVAAILVIVFALPGCAGFQLGSVVYCAKDDNCQFTTVKRAAPSVPAASTAPPAKSL